jgi:hypothetical protein
VDSNHQDGLGGTGDDVTSDEEEEEEDSADADAPTNTTGDIFSGKNGAVKDEPLPSEVFPAKLVPLYPTPQADISYYVTLNKLMAQLSVTCPDADRAMQHLLRGPDVMRLSSGRVVSVDSHADIICLDYLPPDMFESGCRMPMDIECGDLEAIRRVAIRYCHKWEVRSAAQPCVHCGRVHSSASRSVYPVHLFQFIARYLPRLETFYFVDYLTVRHHPELRLPDGCPPPHGKDQPLLP